MDFITNGNAIRFLPIGLLVAVAIACGAATTPIPSSTLISNSTLETIPTPTSLPTSTSIPEIAATLTPTPLTIHTPASTVVSSLREVKLATIQIEAEGSFVDLELGQQLNRRGRSSGLIIDKSGIAVTNNHVVTGAAILRVWVGGERDPRNARILGVSECSDLAVIDIEGDGYPVFEWFYGEIYAGLDVFAAGFPLGDPEFTLTRGIVSKARTRGETNWASVDSVIEHDATINPGNSGGPLVTLDGRVVGINYAGSSDTSQFFAISRDEALEVISQLRAGQDFDSIGVNGTAVRNEKEGISGIWVASVKSGSPASDVGLKGGDVITKLEGLVLATDGTLADYCDILRTHQSDDVLSVEVLRFGTGEVLEGKLNSYKLQPVPEPPSPMSTPPEQPAAER